MSKLGLLWYWLLPGLVYLCPIGALAYYTAGAEQEDSRDESPNVQRRAVVYDALGGSVVIPLARP